MDDLLAHECGAVWRASNPAQRDLAIVGLLIDAHIHVNPLRNAFEKQLYFVHRADSVSDGRIY